MTELEEARTSSILRAVKMAKRTGLLAVFPAPEEQAIARKLRWLCECTGASHAHVHPERVRLDATPPTTR